jgi:mannose-6-phosphate isomerase class I
MLELSFDMLLYYDNVAILGKAAEKFRYQFPIRFNFLDTMNGGNLSLQCHPSVPYIKEHFNEAFTQDEAYYIIDSTPGAMVYLGFQEDIDRDKFQKALEASFDENVAVDVEKFVQHFPSKKHDFFLIPNGTVHSSGVNNMVLEISATPYIYTFKMYDWLRPDLQGKLRTLNIERAFSNLDFNRKGNVVTDTLISNQHITEHGEDWQIVNLSTHPEHFYSVDRLEFARRLTVFTNGQCHVLNLVEGESITVKTGDFERQINFAETFIIPAAVTAYTLINRSNIHSKVVKAFVKDAFCETI